MIIYRKDGNKILQVAEYEKYSCGGEGTFALNYIYKVPEGYVLCDVNHKPMRYFNYLWKAKKYIKNRYGKERYER